MGDPAFVVPLENVAVKYSLSYEDVPVEILDPQDGIMLSQRKYAEYLPTQARLSDQKVAHTPMEINVMYKNDDGDPLAEPTLYRRLIGCLIYLTITRPDISYPVQVLSQFVTNPCQHHFSSLLRIILYVQSTINRGLFFHSTSSLNLEGYTDADWAGCPNSRKSTTGWCMLIISSLISWKCKKQPRISKSSTEVEYRSMSAACSEIVWIYRLMAELHISVDGSTTLHADNTSAIQIATNSVHHETTKHIKVDCQYIQEHVVDQVISIRDIMSHDQLADLFTKVMTRSRHQFLLSKLMLLDK
ncbi:uncharacterized mitochondrial protein AtMg00810-like [Solanum tuberosum]|uniref:uncharacterized mitochondrial protein AtMg00810-like n=1 Tax=Solanum tuberosum TaxID=4113 RepID=UPI00073A0755|nr:PREDICTED: uncharacterized mitochondrial protein AtMg00810-like [Solanum tuberosum]